MTDNSHNTNQNNSALPPELRAIEAGLDGLGSHERASAPTGLEDRLLVASRFHLATGAPSVGSRSGVLAVIGGWRTIRLAAAVAILAAGTVVGVRMMGSGGGLGPVAPIGVANELIAGAPLDDDAARLLALSMDDDDSVWTLGGRLSILESDLMALEAGVSDPWSWFDELDAEDSL